ncbi:TR19L factor, partial [Nyctibius bracteatus]|nr:TR19L factor [Nyctibius bracteatus]
RFYSPEGEREPRGRCLPCATTPRSTPGCPGGLIRCLSPGRRRARSPETPGQPAGTNGTWVTLMGEEEEETAQAAVLTIVPVFCAMGLLGILVCNLLKKKGYHCTASKDPQPCGTGEPQLCCRHLSVILHPSHIHLATLSPSPWLLVLVVPGQSCSSLAGGLHLLPQFPPACRHQQHLHTVQGPAPCARCSQKKWPELLPSLGATKVPKPRGHPAEVTILSIGRFRVSRIPEMRSEVGGGPHPTSSGMWPPWLKSTEGPPEVRGCGGRVVGSPWEV